MTSSKKKTIWFSVALATILTSLWLYHEIQIDKCLDSGGSWNYDAGTCKSGENTITQSAAP